jgi:UDP-N-acetyl-D-mannosaminuronate dehydrogenase
MKIATVGLGYVGLPLSLQFARSCVSVLGIDVDPKKVEHLNNGWAGKKSIEWDRENITSFDLVLIATNHSCINYQELADWAPLIVDTRNALASAKVDTGKVWKA